MPTYVIKVSATVIVHDIEAASSIEAQQIIVADLGQRFPANTEIVVEDTSTTDVTADY